MLHDARLKRLQELVEFCKERKIYMGEFSVADIALIFKLLKDNSALNVGDALLQIKKDGVVYKFNPGDEIDLKALGIGRKVEL